MISFAGKVKDELTRVRLKREPDAKALLAGFTVAIASLKFVPSTRSWGVRYVSESRSAVDFAARLIKQYYNLSMELSVTEHERLRAKNVELTVFGDGIDAFMEDTGLISTDESGERSLTPTIPESIDSEHAQKAFVRGVFLACGSVSNPQKGCHAELVCRSRMLSDAIRGLLLPYGISMKSSVRKSAYVLYVKDGDAVEGFLAYIGASEAVLAVGEQRMIREIRNESNRSVNCITSNMEKTAKTSARQCEDIRLICRIKGIDSLPESLAVIAEARINNPEMTLSELADAVGIGRSAVNYRLGKISQIAQELREG